MPKYKFFKDKRNTRPYTVNYSGFVIIKSSERTMIHSFHHCVHKMILHKIISELTRDMGVYLDTGKCSIKIITDDQKCKKIVDKHNKEQSENGLADIWKYFPPSCSTYDNSGRKVYDIKK